MSSLYSGAYPPVDEAQLDRLLAAEIEASDVGTKALAVKRANVLGQIRSGIPVWQTGCESKFPGTAYVIFPGNVGEASTLREAVEILMGSHEN